MEMAIITPILFAFIFVAIQTGLWFHARNVATSAAQLAVQQTAAYNGSSSSGQQAAYDYLASTGGLSNYHVSAERAELSTVIITGSSPQLLPGLPTPSISVRAAAPLERLVP